jgi:radical SAM superfamily enzyme YgiQ (UPF0313 family)
MLENHELQVIITQIDSTAVVEKKLRIFKPDFICFTACTGDHFLLLKLAVQLKDHFDVPFIWGGPHCSFFPDIIKEKGVDIVVRGEGEYILPRLIENPGDTTLESCWFKKDGKIIKNNMGRLIHNLDELPYPDLKLYRKFYPYLPMESMNIVAGRGCPFNCSFCYNQQLKKMFSQDVKEGHYVRMRSPENVIGQIEEYVRVLRRKPHVVHFRDDTFIFNKKWMAEFLKLYKERIYKKLGIQFTCLGRADLIDEEMVRGLKEAGICMFFWGIEAGSDRLRNAICHKGISSERILECGRLLNKYKIPYRTYNITALPTETLEEAMLTAEINEKIRTPYPLATIFDPYPGTELGDIALSKEYLQEPFTSTSLSITQHDYSVIKVDPRILRFHMLFFYFVKYPFMKKFLTRWIEKDHWIINKFLFYISYGYVVYKSYKYTPREMVQVAYWSFKPLVTFKKSGT